MSFSLSKLKTRTQRQNPKFYTKTERGYEIYNINSLSFKSIYFLFHTQHNSSKETFKSI